MINTVLQNVVLPASRHADRSVLYARWPNGNVVLANADDILELKVGDIVDFSTFFNVFSHKKWHSLTGLEQVSLCVWGRGSVRIVVSSYNETAAAVIVSEFEGILSSNGVEVSVPPLSEICGEILSFQIIALDDAFVEHISWVTIEKAKRDVNLAAVITTFKREVEAIAAVNKFANVIIPKADNHIHLFVVDNGSTLKIDSTDNVTIITNKNLGGAGGFTRGLIEVKNRDDFTHVLFMDDDASCEPESVWRTLSLLRYLDNERASVSGAMLFNDQPCVQYEKGAWVRLHDGGQTVWHANRSGWNLSDVAAVASNDLPDNINYGGWWFFAFPIKAVKHFAFPFFVRGDDVDFSLTNQLPIVTLNGIATWCDNFGYKLNPPTEYLAARSWMALSFMHADSKANKATFKVMIKNALRLGARFDYAGMHAVLDGLEHSLLGPQFFADKPSPLDILARQKSRNKSKRIELEQFGQLVPISWSKKRKRQLVWMMTFGGAFLPTRMVRPIILHTRIAWEAGTWTLLRVGAVAFGAGTEVFVHERDKKEFKIGLKRILKLKLQYFKQCKAVKLNYQNNSLQYKTKEYWDQVLDVREGD